MMSFKSLKLSIVVVFLALSFVALFTDRGPSIERVSATSNTVESASVTDDPVKARAAFNDAVKVFFSARCSNCHPAGDTPTQGDKMMPHTMGVIRGTDGKGAPEHRCDTCHQEMNLEGEGLPPGAPNWHMPPADHKMPFQGVSAAELCRNLKDPKTNGGRKTLKEAVHHVETDPLVMWAWSPGEGRTLPPLSHADFVAKLNDWINNGGACPE